MLNDLAYTQKVNSVNAVVRLIYNQLQTSFLGTDHEAVKI